jgi:hypothetical protein
MFRPPTRLPPSPCPRSPNRCAASAQPTSLNRVFVILGFLPFKKTNLIGFYRRRAEDEPRQDIQFRNLCARTRIERPTSDRSRYSSCSTQVRSERVCFLHETIRVRNVPTPFHFFMGIRRKWFTHRLASRRLCGPRSVTSVTMDRLSAISL